MTWNPLKKTQLNTKLTFASPVVSRADDQELEVIYHRLRHLEETTRRLQKDMKKYLDLIANASKAEQKISADLSASQLCYKEDALRRIVEDYHTVTLKGSESVAELSRICQQVFVEPLKKYGSFFGGIDVAFHRREQLAQEWRNLAARTRKLEDRERTAHNVVKLERERRALAAAGAELVACHASLLAELTQFLGRRGDYLQPVLQALVKAQLDYHGTTTRLFALLIPVPNRSAKTSPASASVPDAQYQESIEDKLSRIRALSIVRSDKSCGTLTKWHTR